MLMHLDRRSGRTPHDENGRSVIRPDVPGMPMWIYDLDTLAFLAVNTAAVMHYGYSEAEFLARTIVDLRPPTEYARLHENLRNTPSSTLEKTGAWIHRKKDGTLISVDITSHPISFHGRSCRCVMAHDITERVQAHNKVARLNRVYAVLSAINSAIVRIPTATRCLSRPAAWRPWKAASSARPSPSPAPAASRSRWWPGAAPSWRWRTACTCAWWPKAWKRASSST
ncbi:PAS domain S-box protein [Massilia cavernae]|uniref:PAS domain S-box protein n=1 Tax=Massilia cavernae TaxID=2320864 RepID=A0A418Y5G8_9BURK|nr:PAS domain S-box protein [Massilia cavernae]